MLSAVGVFACTNWILEGAVAAFAQVLALRVTRPIALRLHTTLLRGDTTLDLAHRVSIGVRVRVRVRVRVMIVHWI